MPPGDLLFDTSAAIAWMLEDGKLHHRYSGRVFAISTVTAGELIYGAAKSDRAEENRRQVEALFGLVELYPADTSVARRYGELKAILRRAGKPIPDNDLWIAATALEHGLELVTRDKHFERVPGLRRASW